MDAVIDEIVDLGRRGFRFIALADGNFYSVTLADLAMAERQRNIARLEQLKALRAERFELIDRLAQLPSDMMFFTQITNTVSQVVHDYGDICQTITALAVEQRAPILVEEFHTLNRCLDTAIAEAVTEHARLTAESRSADEIERLGRVAHELRDSLNTAILAFHTLKRGAVAINGSTERSSAVA